MKKVLIDWFLYSSFDMLKQYFIQLKASSTFSGSFRLSVSGRWKRSTDELKEKTANKIKGKLDENWIKRGVNGAIILPILPTTQHMDKKRCRRFVGKTSTV